MTEPTQLTIDDTTSISKCCIWKSNLSERECMKMIKKAGVRQNIKTSCPCQNKCMSCEYGMNNWTNISRGVQLPILPGCWSRFGKVLVSHSTLHLQAEALHMKGSEVSLWAIQQPSPTHDSKVLKISHHLCSVKGDGPHFSLIKTKGGT